jgi:hypothetical protein
LPLLEAKDALRLFRQSGSRYLIATHFERDRNDPVKVGGWQPIALTAAPFGLPPPRHMIEEKVAGTTKMLGVWPMQDLDEALGRRLIKPHPNSG